MKDNKNCVMVCVTPQQACARLIEAGTKTAEKENTKLMVISVVNNFSDETVSALGELYDCVEANKADMNLYVNNEPVITAAVAAKRFNAKEIITGFPGERSSLFISSLHELVPDIPVTMIGEDGTQYRMVSCTKEEIEEMSSKISLR